MGGVTMSGFYIGFTFFLLLNLLGGLVRILRGPSAADRMLAAQLFGTTGVAVLLVLSQLAESAALRDAALVFALLAGVNTIVFVRHAAAAAEGTGKAPGGARTAPTDEVPE